MRAPRINVFEALALDRADHYREQPEWLRSAWPAAKVVRVDFEGRALVDADRAALIATNGASLTSELPNSACFLGLQESVVWFAMPLDDSDETDATESECARLGLREAAARLPAFDLGLFAYAKALLLWHTRARYCGACGATTQVRRGGHCRQCENDDCRLEHYPRTDAAVITLVRDGDRALIGRGTGWEEKRYSTLAGFIEPGESLEDALRREVEEEAGVRVGACHYHSSQPWPFPASLMVGFYADALDPTIRLGDELADARWVRPEQVLEEVQSGELKLPYPVSVSFRLIADWLLDSLDEDRVRAVVPQA